MGCTLLGCWLAGQNVGIGTNAPTERLHVAGNLRLDNAFMPGNNAGAVGNILLSQGAGVAPAWLANGSVGSVLTIGSGGTPVWAPNPICTSPTLNRFIKFSSTAPTTVCNTTLAENTSNQIWNTDGGGPTYTTTKLEITATGTFPYAISGLATSGVGVYGQTASGMGVLGIANGNSGVGVFGVVTYTSSTGTSIGVYGENQDANSPAGEFVNSASMGSGFGDGVYAQTSQAGAFGVWGINNNNQVNTSPVGVAGSGGISVGVYTTGGAGGSFTGRTFGVAGYKYGSLADGQGGGYFAGDLTGTPLTSTHYVRVAYRTGGTNYKILGSGTASTIVDGLNDKQDRRIMFAPEMPEIHFMDVGQGQMQNGRAYIQLDPIFSRNIVVNEQHPLRVLIQLEDECKGVRVTNKSQYGFEVVELGGGTSNARFTYFVIANRADEKDENGQIISKHEGVRLPPAPGPLPVYVRSAKEEVKRVPLPSRPR